MNEKTAKLCNRLGRRISRVIRNSRGKTWEINDVGRELRREWNGTPRPQRAKLRRRWEDRVRRIEDARRKEG